MFGDQSCQKVLNKFLPDFQDLYAYGLAWSIRHSFRDRSSDVAMVTNFLAKIGILTFILCAGNVDTRVNTTDDLHYVW